MIKVAVVGSGDFLNSLHNVLPQVKDIEIDPYVYQDPKEAGSLIKEIRPCDVVFFAGALPFFFSSKERENLTVPSLYLAQDELTLTSSFLSVIHQHSISLDRISIDLFDTSIALNVYAEIQDGMTAPYVLDYRRLLHDDFNLQTLVDFHQSLWKDGKTDFSITSVHAVFDQLKERDVPVIRMKDPKTALISGLRNAKAMAEMSKSRNAQVAVGFVQMEDHLSEDTELSETISSHIHASIQYLEKNTFGLHSTRGEVESFLENNQMEDFFQKITSPMKIGFGYGATHLEAEQNAHIALKFAENTHHEKCVFILSEEKNLIGPFPKKSSLQRLKNDMPELVEIAKKAKLSPANISKIIQFSKSRHTPQFSASDLEEHLQVTRRSTERIIKRLLDSGFAKIVGEEMTYQQGRPRAIYELRIPIYY